MPKNLGLCDCKCIHVHTDTLIQTHTQSESAGMAAGRVSFGTDVDKQSKTA